MISSYPQLYVMRYMGSKLKLLDFIIPKLESLILPGDPVLDLMAGTHSISYALKSGHPIISNDIQQYAGIIGKAIIENNSINITEEDFLSEILENMKKNKTHTLFRDLYSDTYFTQEQCRDIDDIRYAIDQVKDVYKQALYLKFLIYAMGYCQSSAGHFAQYMPKDHPRLESLRKLSIREAFEKKLKETNIVFSEFKNTTYSLDHRELLSDENLKNLGGTKLVYIDPPYSEAQYSRFYHILETVVKYDYPKVSYKGLYRGDRFQSGFCYKSSVADEFEFVAAQVKKIGAALAISYSDRGLLKPEDIEKICRRHFSEISIFYQDYKHSMQGRGMTDKLKEILITCK